ncbi:CU044_5270 family protein [Nonomuraea longicatena]|uniref:CU044_5270 family protein n=1 Tax=Nonomuraea longicatena TaxID=83682 RepID=A0ABN1PJ36_9ACTN
MNEFDQIKQARPDVPDYDPGTKAMARDRLVRAGGSRFAWRRSHTLAVAGALSLAVAFTATRFLPADAPPQAGPPSVAMPQVNLMSAAQVLQRAAGAPAEEIDPRDDQFIVTESQTMYPAHAFTEDKEERYLYRSKRKIWVSADGSTDADRRAGVLQSEMLEPAQYPGWPIPQIARDEAGRTETVPLVQCEKLPERLRDDYATLKKLPTDPGAMREHLFRLFPGGDKADRTQEVWMGASEWLRESHMPSAQRSALFTALSTLPGIQVVQDAEDAAGRKGIAVGVPMHGVRQELVFDTETYTLLGERGIVVDEKAAKAPVGSLVTSTAQLTVSVADSAPDAPVTEDYDCSKNQG